MSDGYRDPLETLRALRVDPVILATAEQVVREREAVLVVASTVGSPDLPEPWQWIPLTPPDSPEEP